jgi:hypothetical protein
LFESYEYDEGLEKRYVEAARELDLKVAVAIGRAMREAEEGCLQLEREARFIVSPAGGVADYIYDTIEGKYFRAPMGMVLPVLIRHGNVGLRMDSGRIVRKTKVINLLRRRLDDTLREVSSLEAKLKRRPSRYLEEKKKLFEEEALALTKALHFLGEVV